MKRQLINIILLAILSLFVLVYAVASLGIPSGLHGAYTVNEQRALVAHERMNLTQAPLYSNLYIEGERVVPKDGQAGAGATMGAKDCRVQAALEARYGEVEGVAATVYDLDFEGAYRLQYTGHAPTSTLELVFPFPEGLDTLNQVYFKVDGEEPEDVQYNLNSITWWSEVERGEEHEIVVQYRARGVGSFRYALDRNRRLENLDVEIAVRGLTGSEVPENSLPTTSVENGEEEELFAWRYDALIADRDVQVALPLQAGSVQRLQQLQKPLRTLALTSPLFVLLFVACLFGMHRLTGVRLPLQHYLLAGLGFFLFYPALTFLCGLLDLGAAAAVAVAAVTGLQFLFLGRSIGWRRAGWQTLLLCLVFLGLFSLGAMSRLRGLLFTTGGLLLVGAFMLLLARHRPPEPPEPAPLQEAESEGEDLPEPETPAADVQQTEPSEPPPPPSPSRYCPLCGGPLDEGFAFCPACGHEAKLFRRCPACGAEHYAPPEAELDHCPACGSRLADL